MKMNYEHQAVQKSSNTLETTQAQIMMTPEMLDLLSSGVYEYKARAVIRELSCNALDGHTLKGNPDQPFDIHLPTTFEPFFEIRDKGVGLSHEAIMNMYLNYGASTKNDSNDFIGAMGIGSKSPFAISDSFTVRSYFNGMVTTYQAYKENGIPNLTKLMEKPMAEGEETGLAVRVAVRQELIDEFRREAAYVFETFAVRPNINVDINYIDRNSMVMAEKEGVYTAFHGSGNSYSRRGDNFLYIVMGSIRYPVKLDAVMTEDELAAINSNPMIDSIGSLWVYVPIGSVSISASRESLQMNEATKKFIMDAFKDISSDFMNDLQKSFDDIDDYWKAGHHWVNMKSKLRSHSQIAYFAKNLTWKGKTIARLTEEADAARLIPRLDEFGNQMFKKDSSGQPLEVNGQKIPLMMNYEAYCYRWSNLTSTSSWAKRERWSKSNLETDMSKVSPWKTTNDYFNGVLFFVYDRITRSGTEKTTGKEQVLRGMGFAFQEKTKNSLNYLCMVDSRAEAEIIWNRHKVPEDQRHFDMASNYEDCYTPAKRQKGVVKLWVHSYADYHKKQNIGDYRNGFINTGYVNSEEFKVDLSVLQDDENEHLYLQSNNNVIVNGIFNGKGATDVAKLIAPLITGKVVVFNKANWKKIPEDWENASDENVVRKLIDKNPRLWKAMNQSMIESAMPDRFKRLAAMGVCLPKSNDYFGQSMRGRVLKWEGARQILEQILNKPCYSVPQMIDSCSISHSNILGSIYKMLPDCKLKTSIKKARQRMEADIEKNKNNLFNSKYKVLKFIDFNRVQLLELADALDIEFDRTYVNDDGVRFYNH